MGGVHGPRLVSHNGSVVMATESAEFIYDELVGDGRPNILVVEVLEAAADTFGPGASNRLRSAATHFLLTPQLELFFRS